MAKAKVKELPAASEALPSYEAAASEASPQLEHIVSETSLEIEPAASEALVELEEAVFSVISSLPASSGPMKVEGVAELAVVPVEEDQYEGNSECKGKIEEINKEEVKNDGKNEEINEEEVKDDDKDEEIYKEEVKDDGKNEEINEEAVKDDGKNEEVNEEDVKDDGKKEEVNNEDVKGDGKNIEISKEDVKDKAKAESSVHRKAKRRRVKKKAVAAVVGTPAIASATVDNIEKEEMEEEDVKDEGGEVQIGLNKKAKRRWERKKAALAAAARASDVAAVNDIEHVGTSATEKASKKRGMGLIFMCSAKTKTDCFRYKVFGLPATKKDVVAKIEDGTRLFLYDFDLKLMYGIYKATGPGGFNIEPKAFKSKFPSQVRFNVLDDCLPLPEEKFKAAIKENYYAKNKFKFELSPVQVKNLCKLFHDAIKPSKLKNLGEALRTEEVPSPAKRNRKRRWLRDAPLPLPLRYSSLPQPAPVLQPLPVPAYAYERLVGVDYYRRETQLEYPGHRIMDVEMRPQVPIGYRDPDGLYGEPVAYQGPPHSSSLPVGYQALPPHPPHPLHRYQ